jgi:hypothetical protein
MWISVMYAKLRHRSLTVTALTSARSGYETLCVGCEMLSVGYEVCVGYDECALVAKC